jgi:putative two-component system response regulator
MSTANLPLILAVDDEASNLQLLRQILQDHYRLRFAKDGPRALELAREESPDLVLLDVMMPGMDGPTTMSRMRADPALAGIPVVFMTAKAMPQEITRFRQLGAIGVIPKPFDPMRLSEQVFALWENRQ